MTKLERCPFCGGEAYFRTPEHAGTFDVMAVECKRCGASPYAIQVYSGNTIELKPAALAKFWNRRLVGKTAEPDIDFSESTETWLCPHCEEEYSLENHWEFCPNCGQHLSWKRFENAERAEYEED